MIPLKFSVHDRKTEHFKGLTSTCHASAILGFILHVHDEAVSVCVAFQFSVVMARLTGLFLP